MLHNAYLLVDKFFCNCSITRKLYSGLIENLLNHGFLRLAKIDQKNTFIKPIINEHTSHVYGKLPKSM